MMIKQIDEEISKENDDQDVSESDQDTEEEKEIQEHDWKDFHF